MKGFCMPADFKTETLDRYRELNRAYADAAVVETYGNITVGNCFGSGRNVEKLPQVDFDGLRDYIAYSEEQDISFAYTINPSFLYNREFTREGVAEIKAFLLRLREIGVECLIIALPSLIEIAASLDCGFKIRASSICQITSANKALLFKQMGVHGMVVDEAVNRDFGVLRRIRNAFGENVEIIVNSICHQDCHYRMFHYNQISGDSTGASDRMSCAYYPLRCAMRLYADLSNVLKVAWIRPEDLKYYTALGFDRFKLQGRQTVLRGDPVRAVECYFREAYDGDLKDLLFLFAPSELYKVKLDNRALADFLTPFVRNEGFCCRDCSGCDYCETFARKFLQSEEVDRIMDSAREWLQENDPFRKMLAATPPAGAPGGGEGA